MPEVRSAFSKACRLAAAVTFFLVVGTSSWAWSKTQVVFTVDVESQAIPLPRQIEAVCKDGSACGLMQIVQMLDERGLAGTFFLNVYEYPRWGEAAMRDIVAKLQAAGQDVALHTHPETVYDPLRTEMYQYNLDEQTAIIRDGVKLLTAWSGRPVLAHRAGDYSADERTLKALELNGLRIDSSLFWGHPRSRVARLGLARNLPSTIGRLTEIPVTVYQREEVPRFLSDILPPVTSIRKIDVNWFVDEDEARAAIDGIVGMDLPILVVFLHSFSLIAGQGDAGVPIADRHARAILQVILDRVTEKHLPVVSMRDLVESQAVVAISEGQDVVPPVTVRVGVHQYSWHWIRALNFQVLVVGALVLTLLVSGVVFMSARRRRLVRRCPIR